MIIILQYVANSYLFILFINPIFYNEIDTTKLKSFDLKGEEYFFGGFNEVFRFENDSLRRIDNSVDSRVTINPYIFRAKRYRNKVWRLWLLVSTKLHVLF